MNVNYDETSNPGEAVAGQADQSGSDDEPLTDLQNGGAGLQLPSTERPLTMAAAGGRF